MEAGYQKIVSDKYKGLCQRSFETRLELFLFDRILNSRVQEGINTEDFLAFRAPDELVAKYERAGQMNRDEARHIDTAYEDWESANTQTRRELLKAYEPHFEMEILTIVQFKKVFLEGPNNRKCHYTKLTEHEFNLLREKGEVKTKNSRGRYMEIDRLNSNKEYLVGNIVLCCYWANNAKTDEFTEPEFLSSVGPAMAEVFRKRLYGK